MHLHILGICGTFMGGLALIARAAGHKVTGCDAGVYPPMSTQLAEQGIELIEGFGPEQLALKPDLYVIGNVVSRGNPLMEAILESGARYVSGPQWLGDNIPPGAHVLAVAGTHGKTTTSSMLTWILEAAGLAPNFLIGGVAPDLHVSARYSPTQRHFVIEADEYDTAFFDKRSKFVHYRPRTAILNNLEYDHADIFPDLAAIETQFHHLVRTIPGSGRILRPTHSDALDRVLARGCWSETVTFGDDGRWQASEPDAEGAFIVRRDGQDIGTVRWSLGGEHNRMNELAALAAADHAGVPAAQGIEALSRFGGVKRRMELRGTVQGVKVYDDFAHHPTAIATTIAGLRRQVGRPASWPCWSPAQHHETRHHGRPPARCAGWRRPGVLLRRQVRQARAGLGPGRGAGAAGRARQPSRRHRRAGGRGGPGRPTRRPCAGHEQRRLRRHPRQAAGCAGATRLRRPRTTR